MFRHSHINYVIVMFPKIELYCIKYRYRVISYELGTVLDLVERIINN